MLNIKTRPLLIGILFGVLSLYAFSLISEKNSLVRQNRDLIEASRSLGRTLELVQQQNREIVRNVQGSTKEKETLQQSLEKLKKENEEIQLAIRKNEARYESIKEEKSYLEEMLINKTKQIEILNSQQQQQREEAPPAPISYENIPAEGVGQAIQQKNEQLKQLNEQNRVLQEKLDRLYKTTSDKINEINIAKIALSDTVSTARKKIEDEWNTVNLGSVTTSAVSDRDKAPAEAKQPKSEGHVLAINNEHGFVVIDLGKVDNLSSESTLTVKKNGLAIATLNILEIRDVMAACNIRDLQDGQRVEINDPVSILR